MSEEHGETPLDPREEFIANLEKLPSRIRAMDENLGPAQSTRLLTEKLVEKIGTDQELARIAREALESEVQLMLSRPDSKRLFLLSLENYRDYLLEEGRARAEDFEHLRDLLDHESE